MQACTKQIHRDGQPVHTHHVGEFDNTFDDRATVLRRRLHESGWVAWAKVPPGDLAELAHQRESAAVPTAAQVTRECGTHEGPGCQEGAVG